MFYLCAVNNTIISMRNWMENGLVCMWISLLVGLLSCAERPALDFDSIERIMPQQPDSALLRLDTAHVDPLRLSDADRAHYYLLLTEALDKCYQTPRSDSLISAAIHYYKGKHDPNRLAKAWYYKGRILQDQNMPLQAQDAYLEASNVEGVTDYSLLARLYNHLGSLYLYQDVYEKAIDFLRKAYFYYEKIEHQNGLSSVQVNMARAFHGLGAIDSAQYYYERLLPLAQGSRIRTLPSELGDLYREQGAMDKVYPLMQLALEWQPKEEKRAPIYLALGEYFLSVHQLDSADLYFRKAMMPTASIYTIAQCHRNRYRLQKELGRPKEALRHLEQFSAYADSISAMTREASIRKVDAFYNYQRMQKQVAEAQLNAAKSRNLNYLMCLVALAVIFALSLIFLQWKRRVKEAKWLAYKREQTLQSTLEAERRRYETEKTNIESELHRLQTTNQQLNQNASEMHTALLRLRKNELDLCAQMLETKENKEELSRLMFSDTAIFHRFHEMAASPSADVSKQDWTQLEDTLNDLFPHFLCSIQRMAPKLSNMEKQTCMLVKMGIPNRGMKKILDYSNVSLLQARIFTKLSGKPKGSVKEFTQLIDSL